MTPDAVHQLLAGAMSEARCSRWCRVAVEQREGAVALLHWAIRAYPDGYPGAALDAQGEDRRKQLLAGYLTAGHEGRGYDFAKGSPT